MMQHPEPDQGGDYSPPCISVAFVAAACGSDDDDAADATDAPAATDAAASHRQRLRRPRPRATHRRPAKPSRSTGGTSRTTIPARPTGKRWPTPTRPSIPNVKINITVMENEAFKAAIQTNIQSGDVPDLFQSWGGGGLRDQVAAGVVRDITAEATPFVGDLGEGAVKLYQVDGVQYGIPYNAGMVGFWYNKDLFTRGRHHGAAGDVGRAARRRRS